MITTSNNKKQQDKKVFIKQVIRHFERVQKPKGQLYLFKFIYKLLYSFSTQNLYKLCFLKQKAKINYNSEKSQIPY
ncbi:hypothetical protein pb186bvf_014047 [Paramecium bursaria]